MQFSRQNRWIIEDLNNRPFKIRTLNYRLKVIDSGGQIPTIWSHLITKWYVLKTEPFKNQTDPYHSNSECVRYSSPIVFRLWHEKWTIGVSDILYRLYIRQTYYSGDLKSDPTNRNLETFKIQNFWRLDFKWSLWSEILNGPNYSKTRKNGRFSLNQFIY